MADIELVSWDVDDTLYDNRAMKRRLIAMTLRHPWAAAREVVPIRRYQWALEACRRRGGVLGSALTGFDRDRLSRLEQRWAVPPMAAVGPRPGVKRALERIAGRGITQVVLSDYRAGYKVDVLGLGSYFAAIYEGEELGFIKPRPEGLQKIAADFDVEPSRILHLGDGIETDGAAARAAGVSCLILGHDFQSFDELDQRIP